MDNEMFVEDIVNVNDASSIGLGMKPVIRDQQLIVPPRRFSAIIVPATCVIMPDTWWSYTTCAVQSFYYR